MSVLNCKPQKIIVLFFITISLIWGVIGKALSASFEAGLAAYKNKDYETAVSVWLPLAKMGNISAQSLLGLMYARGDGVSLNYSKSLTWYRLAADQNDASAHWALGVMHDKGLGVLKNFDNALIWFVSAAMQREDLSKNKFVLTLEENITVPFDYRTLIRWLKLAVDQGLSLIHI